MELGTGARQNGGRLFIVNLLVIMKYVMQRQYANHNAYSIFDSRIRKEGKIRKVMKSQKVGHFF